MIVQDPGHTYLLSRIDGNGFEQLSFVKRIGHKFPGNKPLGYPGTNIQEVCRCLINRIKYLHNQEKHWINPMCICLLRLILNMLEFRAASRHRRSFSFTYRIELLKFNTLDGHIRYEKS